MPGYQVTISSFGALPSHVNVPNNNGITIQTNTTQSIGTGAVVLSSASTIAIDNANIDRGALLDGDLKGMLELIQTHFITKYMDFSMNELDINIKSGFLQEDPNRNNGLFRDVSENGVMISTTDKLMRDLNEYVQTVKNLPENIDISNNDVELRKRDASYLISTYALRTIGVVNRGLLCWIENNMLNDTIIQLQEEQLQSSQMQSSMVFDITATATLDIRYLAYIVKYGNPVEGVFDPVKLAEFI